jgi:hypothetical protein
MVSIGGYADVANMGGPPKRKRRDRFRSENHSQGRDVRDAEEESPFRRA